MHIALFVVYTVLCAWAILKLPVFRRSGIRPALLMALFGLHVAAGCIHNVIAWRYYPGHGDIWDSFQWSLLLRDWLSTDFQHFLLANSRWTYFTHNGIIFIHLLLNFISFDNIYINTLLFSFPVFLGNIALYRVFRRHFPVDPLTAILVFLLPSTLFWTACLFREAVLFMLLGFFFDQIDRLSPPKPQQHHGILGAKATGATGPILSVCCCFLLILYFRFSVGLFLIPALFAKYWIGGCGRKFLLRSSAAIGIIAIAAFLVFPPFLNRLLVGLGHWQMQFQQLEGHSRLYLPTLDGTLSGLFRTTPYALLNGLFQPLPGSGGRPIYFAFSVELVLTWIIVAIALVRAFFFSPRRADRQIRTDNSFAAACLVFAFLGMIGIGAMVPFAGAIVRYRSIYLPFLLAPALHTLRDMPPFRQLNAWLSNRL
jgi:hypothetical protein